MNNPAALIISSNNSKRQLTLFECHRADRGSDLANKKAKQPKLDHVSDDVGDCENTDGHWSGVCM